MAEASPYGSMETAPGVGSGSCRLRPWMRVT
ncbi:hypothetical protein MCA0680 [Methylococcus capsulatus str. Bath]|uniref:Uncharacterized protein n=1 Tax=Methylococcus capsulatus (strain ATCC 33009 / NCIMB 11132 / Bath) TaxID=243233 RepID=Q60B06_METCA|nr:hypothetical protein MCA0680 [Methylococcus capsulatus str. Bath]